MLNLAFKALLFLFIVSALFGLVGFLIDIIRFPQKHEKVKIIPSNEEPPADETADGLILDENVRYDYESNNTTAI